MSFKIFYTSLLWILSTLTVRVDPLTRDVYWRDYIPGQIPYDAIEAAPGMYIGLVSHDGFMLATIYPETKTTFYVYYGHKTAENNVKILCSRSRQRFYWEEVDFTQPHDQQMRDAVKGGFVVSWDANIFIGKVHHEGQWKIGIVFEIAHPKWAGLWVWTAGGGEVRLGQFHMLKYNSTGVKREYGCKCFNRPIRQDLDFDIRSTN